MISARQEELARLESVCSGKPITDCRAEVQAAARYFRFYGAAVNYMTGQTIPVNATGLDLTLREPIGVCALIVPWNGPIAVAAKKAAPALAAGNSIVLKPAPPTPLTALELESICREAGVPPGVFNVLTGSGREVGPAARGSSLTWRRSASPAAPTPAPTSSPAPPPASSESAWSSAASHPT